ncbi:response regulator [Rhizobium sp. C4]|uniref:response regulator n=1 Tax=Rhizobium sp. C4 TaxID=1349800 RepID=UPI001E57FA7A|nr:response regulator [Rhizobium sp. C4]MCD2173126.1 response regulator [Rhizobium sp. C4]
MALYARSGTTDVKILLVEDDDGDAKALIRAFAKANIGNPIIRAQDGVEALAYLKGEGKSTQPRPPILLLVDLNMPRMNGIEFIRALRADPDLRRTVAFLLTTSKREEDMAAAYDLNVAGYIVKQNAGVDFLNLVGMIDSFWKIVELPT